MIVRGGEFKEHVSRLKKRRGGFKQEIRTVENTRTVESKSINYAKFKSTYQSTDRFAGGIIVRHLWYTQSPISSPTVLIVVIRVFVLALRNVDEFNSVFFLDIAEVGLIDSGRLRQFTVSLQVTRLVWIVFLNNVRFLVLVITQTDQNDVADAYPDLVRERWALVVPFQWKPMRSMRSSTIVTFFLSLPRI